MQYSVLNKSKLQGNLRIDAEFYSPDFLLLEETLNSHQTALFSTYSVFVKKGIFDLSPDRYTDQGIPLIRTSEIKDPLIDFSTTVFLDEKTHDANKKTELNPGDIVFTKIGAYIGDVAILPQKYNRYNFSQNVTGVKLKKDEIKPGFLLAFLLSKYGNQQIKRLTMLSGQGKLELEDIKNIKVISLGGKIESLVQDIVLKAEVFKEKSVIIYQEAEQILLSELGLLNWRPKHRLSFIKSFSDTKSANRLDAEYFQPMYEEIINAVKRYKGGFVRLEKVAKTTRGSLISDTFYNGERGTPYIRGADFSSGFLEDNKLVYIDNSFAAKNETRVKKGEIVFALIGTVGTTVLVDEKFNNAFISNNLGKIAIQNYSSTVLQVLLHSAIGKMYFEKVQMQTAQPKISDKDIYDFVLPDLGEKIWGNIEKLYQKSQESKRLSKSLLEIAKRGVEMAIEKDEQTAMEWINKNVKD
jgi:hypothetical protein